MNVDVYKNGHHQGPHVRFHGSSRGLHRGDALFTGARLRPRGPAAHSSFWVADKELNLK